ncbi:MAG: AzlD domain-containing protein [Rhodospirillaceae bacterium]|nr:AzlD domain-containing protein [Rhodospirillaceae bacterium]
MTDTLYLFGVIVVMAVATFATRVFPFVALKGRGDHPTLDFLGRYMPPAVMTILVLYSLKSIELTNAPYGANELIALGITTAVHLWKGNSLLSIIAGTVFYMTALQQGLFL